MRRLTFLIAALLSACMLDPLPAQTIAIEGPDTVALAPGAELVVRTTARATNGRLVTRASVRCDALAAVRVRGDTLSLGEAAPGLTLVRCSWLRSDGLRPADTLYVRTGEIGVPPPVPDTALRPPGGTPPAADTTPPALPVVRSIAFDASLADRSLRRPNGWDDIDLTRGWQNAAIVNDPTGLSRQVLQVTFPAGMRSGVSPISPIQTLGNLGLHEATITISLYVDQQFRGNSASENKQIWAQLGGNNIFLTLRGQGAANPLLAGVKLQGTLDPRQEARPDGYVAGGVVPRGRWVELQLYLRMNSSAAAADGVIALAVDGQEVGRLTDVRFTTRSAPGSTPVITGAKLEPTWGGGGPDVPQTGHIDYTGFRVEGR